MIFFKFLFSFFIFIFLFIQCDAYCNDIWPAPTSCQDINVKLQFDPKIFKFRYNQSLLTCDIFAVAISRYSNLLTAENCDLLKNSKFRTPTFKYESYLSTFSTLDIHFDNLECDSVPENADESYSLFINGPVGKLTADSIWGILRGLETFLQTIQSEKLNGFKNQLKSHYQFKNKISTQALIVHALSVHDSPRFNFRGFLVDTSRHFLSLRVIFEFLEAMEMSKLNVFHWHIVDDQSFPYESERFPQISNHGSYSHNHVYTTKDVDDVIEFARLRGIRVLVEFDTPGHTLSWKEANPNFLTKCFNESTGKPDGTFGPIDPTKNENFEFLQEFFTEIRDIFPDEYIHLGGDEVDFKCWKSNPNISQFMSENSIQTYEQLESFYFQKLLDILSKIKKQFLVWQEVLDNNVKLPSNTVVHIWKGEDQPTYYKSELFNVTKKGYKTVLSSPWYLNYINYGIDWEKYYKADPQDFDGSEEQKNLVIGGEACMWGEHVDGTNVVSRSWARGAAVAERLWSPKHVNDFNEAKKRLDRFRCRMINRGIQAEPITGPGFCECDYLL